MAKISDVLKAPWEEANVSEELIAPWDMPVQETPAGKKSVGLEEVAGLRGPKTAVIQQEAMKKSLNKPEENWVKEGLKKTVRDIGAGIADLPAQIQDLMTTPSRILNLPAPPLRSELATRAPEALTTPLPGEYPTSLSLDNLRSFISGQGFKDTTQGGPTPLDIAVNAAAVGIPMYSQIKESVRFNKALAQNLAQPIMEARMRRAASAIDVPGRVIGEAPELAGQQVQQPVVQEPVAPVPPIAQPEIGNMIQQAGGKLIGMKGPLVTYYDPFGAIKTLPLNQVNVANIQATFGRGKAPVEAQTEIVPPKAEEVAKEPIAEAPVQPKKGGIKGPKNYRTLITKEYGGIKPDPSYPKESFKGWGAGKLYNEKAKFTMDVVASSLQEKGLLDVPENMNPSDVLMQKIKDNEKLPTAVDEFEAGIEKAQGEALAQAITEQEQKPSGTLVNEYMDRITSIKNRMEFGNLLRELQLLKPKIDALEPMAKDALKSALESKIEDIKRMEAQLGKAREKAEVKQMESPVQPGRALIKDLIEKGKIVPQELQDMIGKVISNNMPLLKYLSEERGMLEPGQFLNGYFVFPDLAADIQVILYAGSEKGRPWTVDVNKPLKDELYSKIDSVLGHLVAEKIGFGKRAAGEKLMKTLKAIYSFRDANEGREPTLEELSQMTGKDTTELSKDLQELAYKQRPYDEAAKQQDKIDEQELEDLEESNGPQYLATQKDYEDSLKQGLGKKGLSSFSHQKKVPYVKEKVKWEKSKAWEYNLGRDIAGIFEKQIGPELQVSARLKKWLGVYYPMLGPNGTIRIRTVGGGAFGVTYEKARDILNHETGHFLDSVLGNYPIEKKGEIKDELIAVTHYLDPFEERYVPIIDKETGEPKIGVKTKKPLMKQDYYTAYRRKRSELFAQYISLYTGDPAKAQEIAPKFTAIVENEIAKNTEFAYVVNKLREFEAEMLPLKDYTKSLRAIPEIVQDLKDWEKQGNLARAYWQGAIGDKLWNLIKTSGDKLSKLPFGQAFFEKKGLDDKVFEVIRQMRKLIEGQTQRLEEEITTPISKLKPSEQQAMAERLQEFSTLGQDNLTDEARKEMSLWGNELRKLGLMNDLSFFNEVGQYFPAMYTAVEFKDNMVKLYPTKPFYANLGMIKHRMTDEEFGIEVMKAKMGSWPSQLKKIAMIPKEELIDIGRKAREEMGLMKEQTAYVVRKRVGQMIQTVYTIKAFNSIAGIPGIIGAKNQPNYAQMPEGAKYGKLSGQWVPKEIVSFVGQMGSLPDAIDKFVAAVNSAWKLSVVPWSPPAVTRNIVSNTLAGWLIADVPLLNPIVYAKGMAKFFSRGDIYKALRDKGLYKNTYSQQEMQALANYVKPILAKGWVEGKEPPEIVFIMQKVVEWAVNTFQAPSKIYGAVEDIGKTIIANYAMEKGASVEQAIKLADKALFDYSSISLATKKAKGWLTPFFTWSAKMFPRLVETAIRKPDKILAILASIAIYNAYKRHQLGITKEQEEALKPDNIKGRSALLIDKDKDGKLHWLDLSYFTLWDNFLPGYRRGKRTLPQAFGVGNPFMTLYNAYVLNYDPYLGTIAPPGLPEAKENEVKNDYVMKRLGMRIITKTPNNVWRAYKGIPQVGGEKKSMSDILGEELLGLRTIADISGKEEKIGQALYKDFIDAQSFIKKQYQNNQITKEEALKLRRAAKEELMKKVRQLKR